MRLETFFEKFDLFVSAPSAVAKMRELVRQLAVQGKLAPQHPMDEPASLALAASGVDLKRWRVDDAEQRYEVPETWTWLRFAGVGEQRLGKMLDGAKNKGELKPYLRNTNVQWMRFELDDVKEIRVEEKEKSELRLTKGDLLICEGGEPGRCAIWNDQLSEMYFQKALHRVRPCEAILSEFLALHLQVDCQNGVLAGYFTGATIKHLTGRSLDQYPIPLPPLAEQRRIVAKVDELMTLCDRLEAQQQERETRHTALARASLARFAEEPSPANLNIIFHKSYDIAPADLRKSILALAVQGKLVPQDLNDEPAEEILARIAEARFWLQKTGKGGEEKTVDPLQPDNLPFEAPESWRWVKLVELTELITKGSSPKWQGIEYVAESEGVLFITSENVGNYRLRKLDGLKYVEKRFNEIEPRSILKRGDILMNLVGASIGRTAVYDLHDGANINQAVALIRLVRETEGICPGFLLHYLNSPSAIDYMLSSRVVSAQPNISLTDAREFAVPIPPLAEQRRIVEKVDELMALVDALETKLATARTTAVKLLDALVAELTAKA